MSQAGILMHFSTFLLQEDPDSQIYCINTQSAPKKRLKQLTLKGTVNSLWNPVPFLQFLQG